MADGLWCECKVYTIQQLYSQGHVKRRTTVKQETILDLVTKRLTLSELHYAYIFLCNSLEKRKRIIK